MVRGIVDGRALLAVEATSRAVADIARFMEGIAASQAVILEAQKTIEENRASYSPAWRPIRRSPPGLMLMACDG
jgi:hypothetical protein